MPNGSRTNFCYLSNDAIYILKPVDRKIILPSVITLPHFPLNLISAEPITLPGGPECEKRRDRSCMTCTHAISEEDCEARGQLKRCNNPDVS